MQHSAPASLPSALSLSYDDGVPYLVLPQDLPFADLRAWLRDAVEPHVATLSGRTVRLHFGSRDIVLFDVRRLLHMLREEHRIDVTGLYVTGTAVHRYAERELKLKLFAYDPVEQVEGGELDGLDRADDGALPGLGDVLAALSHDDDDQADPGSEAGAAHVELLPDSAIEAAEPAALSDAEAALTLPAEPNLAERRTIPVPDLPEDAGPGPATDPQGARRTLTVHRTLRSGSSLRFDGDLVIAGDVNPGAEVQATGNVLVLGRLRGVVHAGCQGDESAFILAFELAPTQVRIARAIAVAPKRPSSGDAFFPEVATVSDGQVVLEPYRGRLRR